MINEWSYPRGYISQVAGYHGMKDWLMFNDGEGSVEYDLYHSSDWNKEGSREVIFEKVGQSLKLFIDGELVLQTKILLLLSMKEFQEWIKIIFSRRITETYECVQA